MKVKVPLPGKVGSKHRLSLTAVFSVAVLVVFLTAALVVFIAWIILSKTGALAYILEYLSPETLIILVMLISVAVGMLLTFLFGPLLLKPLNRVIDSMTLLSSGQFETRIIPKKFWNRISFVREFTESFNRMADEFAHTEMLRSDFINSFSHEFKTPIVSIAGFAKLLKSEGIPEKQRAEYLGVIEKESLRLSDMANKVLALTRVESRKLLPDRREFNLSEQIRECLLLFTDAWSEKDLSIEPDFDEVTICAEKELLEQVWINLIENAVKFTPRGGTVRVEITEGEGNVTVSVHNTGSSIAPENRERVFRKFFREDSSHAAPGNGVGLAVVRRVAELHGGTVTCGADETGTVFTVVLPKGK